MTIACRRCLAQAWMPCSCISLRKRRRKRRRGRRRGMLCSGMSLMPCSGSPFARDVEDEDDHHGDECLAQACRCFDYDALNTIPFDFCLPASCARGKGSAAKHQNWKPCQAQSTFTPSCQVLTVFGLFRRSRLPSKAESLHSFAMCWVWPLCSHCVWYMQEIAPTQRS